MTIFIAIPCSTGVVVSADSQVTYTDTNEVQGTEVKIHLLETSPPFALCMAGSFEIAGSNGFDGRASVKDYILRDPNFSLGDAVAYDCGCMLADSFGQHINANASHMWPGFVDSDVQLGLLQVRHDGSVAFGCPALKPANRCFTTDRGYKEVRQGDAAKVWKVGAMKLTTLVSQSNEATEFASSGLRVDQVTAERAVRVSRAIIAAAASASTVVGGPIHTVLLEHHRGALVNVP